MIPVLQKILFLYRSRRERHQGFNCQQHYPRLPASTHVYCTATMTAWELLLVRTGSGYYIVDDEKFEIKAGNIVVCNEGSLHDEVPEYNRQLSMIAIAIDDVYIKGLPKNHLIPDTVKPVLKVGKEFVLMDAMFQSIFESLAFGTEGETGDLHLSDAGAAFTCTAFIWGIWHPKSRYAQKNSSALLHDIKKYIDDNFAEDLSLPKISEQFFISQSYLSHLFKRKLGYSPMHYIVRETYRRSTAAAGIHKEIDYGNRLRSGF